MYYVLRSTVLLLLFGIRKNCHRQQWKESYYCTCLQKGGKTDCSNYGGISLLQTTYKILSYILVSRLIPYIDEIIGDHHCGFRYKISTNDQIFSIRQILEK
jgi:hypothetical protein